jgi:hypothetical protein
MPIITKNNEGLIMEQQHEQGNNREFRPEENSLPSRSILQSILHKAVEGILSLAKFSGFIITTNVADMEQGLSNGGDLHIEPHAISQPNIQGWKIQNSLISCIYLRSISIGPFGHEMRESLHLIRTDLPGGVILEFTDEVLVGGITNTVRRISFLPQEIEIGERLLHNVKELV